MAKQIGNANRVAFNTGIRYVQLALNILIGLYSVRLILNALGEVDYGIYDVIGGVVTLLAFISESLSQASMRFISIRLGEGNLERMRKTFSACIWLHIAIAAGLAIAIEIIGTFLFKGYFNIPIERIHASKIVYHTVTVTLFLNIFLSPFRALIAAYEQFWYTSLIAFMNSALKLMIAVAITYWFSDKLIAYGMLLLLITVLDVFFIVGFAYYHHSSVISIKPGKLWEVKSITSFVGWTMLDVLGSTLNRQGYAVILNRFFGPVVNTTFALSRQIEGQLYAVSSSAIGTVTPQIMKSYGAGDTERMFRLSLTAGKFGFAMISLIAIPLIVMMPEVLNLWLKQYPEDTVLFSRLMIIACMLSQLTMGLVSANQAMGNIKWFSIVVSTSRFLALPISWICLKIGMPAYVAIIVFLLCEVIGSLARAIILSKISDFRVVSFFKSVLLKMLPPVILAIGINTLLYSLFPHTVWNMLLIFVLTSTVYALSIYMFGVTVEEKCAIDHIFSSSIRKIKRCVNW